jgi:DNA-binding response OmpR family regulator
MRAILLVEPDPEKRRSLCRKYSSAGRVLEAESALKAEKIIGTVQVDTIVIAVERASEPLVKSVLETAARIEPTPTVMWHPREE